MFGQYPPPFTEVKRKLGLNPGYLTKSDSYRWTINIGDAVSSSTKNTVRQMIYSQENIRNSNKPIKILAQQYEKEVSDNLREIYESNVKNLQTVLKNLSHDEKTAFNVLEDPSEMARYIDTKDQLEWYTEKLNAL